VTTTAILLVLLSTVTHAAWNALVKRNHPAAAFFLAANLIGVLLLIPVFFALRALLAGIPPSVWRSLAAAGFFQALYYIALAAAYRAGDMSVAYPLARAVPVLLTTVAVSARGGPGAFTVLYVVGCVLVVGGILSLPLSSGPGTSWRVRLTSACVLLALLAAVGTTGYSLVDSAALSTLRNVGGLGAVAAALLYLALEAASSTAFMAVYVLARRRERQELSMVVRDSLHWAALTGLGIYFTYGLVLIAMAFARNVGYIVAFRQISVPLGSLAAIVALKERASPTRTAAIVLTSVGLMLVALG
jgi:drug/metabolite transporter (DMT)-like permease